MSDRLVWTTDCKSFVIRDRGMLRFVKREQVSDYATAAEIRAAIHRAEAATMPLPQYDAESGMYYWDDPSDLWNEEDIADDIRKLWPLMDASVLLESSRLMDKLYITE